MGCWACALALLIAVAGCGDERADRAEELADRVAQEVDAALAEARDVLAELRDDPRIALVDPEKVDAHAGEDHDGEDGDAHGHAETPREAHLHQRAYERAVRRSNRVCTRIVTRLQRRNPQLLAIGRATVDGGGVAECISAGAEGPRHIGDRIFFQRAYQRADFAVGDYEFDAQTKARYLGVALPIPGAVLFARISLDALGARIASLERSEGVDYVVADENGTVIVRPSISYFTGRSLKGIDELVDAMLERDSGTETIAVEERERLYAFAAPELADGSLRVAVGIP